MFQSYLTNRFNYDKSNMASMLKFESSKSNFYMPIFRYRYTKFHIAGGLLF